VTLFVDVSVKRDAQQWRGNGHSDNTEKKSLTQHHLVTKYFSTVLHNLSNPWATIVITDENQQSYIVLYILLKSVKCSNLQSEVCITKASPKNK